MSEDGDAIEMLKDLGLYPVAATRPSDGLEYNFGRRADLVRVGRSSRDQSENGEPG